MKPLFYVGIGCLAIFEILNVYFIMPMPGSQEMNSIHLAYFLYKWRWAFRLTFGLMTISGFHSAFLSNKIIPSLCITAISIIIYFTNFDMAADVMFYQPKSIKMKDVKDNKVDLGRLVLGVSINGQSKAYPIQFLGYHHQVRDSIGGTPIMVTYCTVCRTGRVYEPKIKDRHEEFRLVGMDHYNAMFEDKTTKSWWRQSTGEAVTGSLLGTTLPEIESYQISLEKWIDLHPTTLIMQADEEFQVKYDSLSTYESGRLTGKLTVRDTNSWRPKSWIIGIRTDQGSKAYDWNRLKKEKLIQDEIGSIPIVIFLSKDNKSFIALQRSDKDQYFEIKNDTLIADHKTFSFFGKSLSKEIKDLKKLDAYQEYWHSWQTFHPTTAK